jgi:hypothetical protein
MKVLDIIQLDEAEETYSVKTDTGEEFSCNDKDHAVNKARNLLSYKKADKVYILKNGKAISRWQLNSKLQPLDEAEVSDAWLKSTGISAEELKNIDPNWIKWIQSEGKRNEKTLKAAKQAEFVKKVGRWAWFLRAIAAFAATFELYYTLSVLEKDYMDGKLNQYQYQKAREIYWGFWEVTMLVPVIASLARTATLVRWILLAFTFILTLGWSAATGFMAAPAAIAGIAVEASLITAVQAFLMTDQFRNWLSNSFIGPLVLEAGTITDDTWNQLRKIMSEIPGFNKFMDNVGKTFYDSQATTKAKVNLNAAAKDAELAKKFDTAISPNLAPNAVVINGVRVTDTDGFKNPYAVMDLRVQNYIKDHPEAAKQIDSLPIKPLTDQEQEIKAKGSGYFDTLRP